jgi:predicted RNase H-like nuclease
MFVVGVDGCKNGWLGIKISSSKEWEIEVFKKFYTLWQKYQKASLILVDMPIGLKDDDPEERQCDKEARKKLGQKRGSSVFRVPCRPTIYFYNNNIKYEEVVVFNKRLIGIGLSKQTVAIIPKIREIDEFITNEPEARTILREVHPEICFWSLNGQNPAAYSKTKKEEKKKGLEERLRILKSFFAKAEDIIHEGLSKFKRKDVSRDDLLDALAAAVTGLLGLGNLKTLPDTPERDAHGLPMEMVYYIPER